LVKRDRAARIESVAENLRTEVIAASGHFVLEEAPEAVIRILREFFRKTLTPGRAGSKSEYR